MLPKVRDGHFEDYSRRLSAALEACDWQPVSDLADELLDCARTGRQVFIAGNGGSAANAVHLANDFLYAWSKQQGRGIRVHALPANTAVMSCLANDEGYDEVFSGQLAVHAVAPIRAHALPPHFLGITASGRSVRIRLPHGVRFSGSIC